MLHSWDQYGDFAHKITANDSPPAIPNVGDILQLKSRKKPALFEFIISIFGLRRHDDHDESP